MANTFNLGNGNWAQKTEKLLAYNAENDNYKPLPFDFDRGSTATRVNKNGLIETVGVDEPRIDFLNNTKGHLLLEPERTNLITYSEDFSQWSKQSSGTGLAPIITSNNAISPDGNQNADKIVFNKGTGVLTSDLSVISSSSFTSQSNTTSFYIKADSPQKIVFRNSTNWQLVNVTTEWQRISKTDTGTGVQIGLRDGYGISGIPDTATIYLWGAQAEAATYATSYIPTQGSAVTRSAETCNGAGNSNVFNDSEGVLYAEIAKDTTSVDGGVAISDSSYTNRVLFYFDTSGNIRAYVYSSGVQANIITSGLDYTQNNKLALKYSATSTKFFVNGFQVGSTDTSSTMPVGLSELVFDDGGGGSDFYGKVKDVRYYNTALSDSELQALTS